MTRLNRSDGATPTRDARSEAKQLFVMIAMGGPGLAIWVWGLKQMQWAGHATVPGVLCALLGGLLVLACGCYHYLKDYSGPGKARGIVAFLLVTVVPATLGVLLVRLFVRG